jgi:hypothetical protein
MTPPTDERVKELADEFKRGVGYTADVDPSEKIGVTTAAEANVMFGDMEAVCTELLATRQALREAKEALRAGADSLLVEQTRWERRRYISGLLADKLTAEKIGAQSAQLRALAGPLPPLPTLPEMGKS